MRPGRVLGVTLMIASPALLQLGGALAALVSGHIVEILPDGRLAHFPWVGIVLIGTTLVVGVLIWRIQRGVLRNPR